MQYGTDNTSACHSKSNNQTIMNSNAGEHEESILNTPSVGFASNENTNDLYEWEDKISAVMQNGNVDLLDFSLPRFYSLSPIKSLNCLVLNTQ